MREQLLPVIEQDLTQKTGSRRLAVIRCADFDRVASFDQQTGVALIASVADKLRSAVRSHHFIAQIDRDTFAIWFRGPEFNASEFKALIFVIGQPIQKDGRDVSLHIEVGSVSHPAQGDTPAKLLAAALASLSPVCKVDELLTSPSHSEDGVREQYVLERDLASAIERDELFMMYQPVVDLAEGRLVGAEALLRWTHPELGPVSPARFIPIMEQVGLSDVYGMWVLNTAARQARRWREAGFDLKVAVNLSALQLLDPKLTSKIIRTLERHRLPPHALELELTETAAMVDADRTAHVFRELQAANISLAIDDFGTGYSSLSYLKKLPFNKLKIDREFVTDLQHRADSRAICRALVELGRGLNLSVLAEGVEREDEMLVLRDLGCRLFQGYYFAKPLEAEAFCQLAGDPDWITPFVSPVHRQFGQLHGRLSA